MAQTWRDLTEALKELASEILELARDAFKEGQIEQGLKLMSEFRKAIKTAGELNLIAGTTSEWEEDEEDLEELFLPEKPEQTNSDEEDEEEEETNGEEEEFEEDEEEEFEESEGDTVEGAVKTLTLEDILQKLQRRSK